MFKQRTVFEIGRGIKAFLALEAGLTRGELPSFELVKPQSQRIAQRGKRIEQLQDALAEKEETLKQVRQQLADKSAELNELKAASSRRQNPLEVTPIFFVVGLPRSGTNWLMRTLNSHPEILCRGEGRFFGRNIRSEDLIEMQPTKHLRRKIQPSSLHNALAESEYLRLWMERSVWTRDEDTEKHVTNLTREAINYFLKEKLAKTNKRMVGDKTPLGHWNSLEIIEEIGEICPDARVIHIIRDGRDVAVSWIHFLWDRGTDQGGIYHLTPDEQDKRDRYRKNLQEFLNSGEGIFTEERIRKAAENWNSRVRAASREFPSSLGDNYAEVRYENLLERPEEEFGRLFRFLGARADKKLVARCVEATSFEKRSGGRRKGQEDTKSAARKGIAGDWKNVFTEQDKAIYKEVAGDLLIELGYEKDYDW